MGERTMGVTIQKDGMLVRTLFSEKKIPGHEIRSIEYDDKCVLTVTLNSGKVMKLKSYPVMYDEELGMLIREYNIPYRNLNDMQPVLYTGAEVGRLIDETMKAMKDCAGATVRARLGQEYDVDVALVDKLVNSYAEMRLTKNGEPVKDLTGITAVKMESDVLDDMDLAFLCEWDSQSKSGKYGVTNEVKDFEACRKYILDSFLEYLFD
ncbi:MAG: hypothetical protein IKX54_06045 [Lachnospiraceae bacterium]|nr:hypothetical protein [Lachnospiraceae bacterium]